MSESIKEEQRLKCELFLCGIGFILLNFLLF